MMIVLTLAFSSLFRTTQAFATYVLSGLIVWTFFSQTTTTAMMHLAWGGALMNRIYVPRTAFAISSVGTGLVNLVLSLIPLGLVMAVTATPIRPAFAMLPLAIAMLALFALGVALLLSTLAVYFPDVAEMYQVVLLAWMYLTPIIYPEEIVPAAYQIWMFTLNPMYHLVKLFRLAVYYGAWPGLTELAAAGALSLGTLVIGWVVFTKRADEFAYRV
jgi:ABC-type polysaccharide/polyol phosphate export permease